MVKLTQTLNQVDTSVRHKTPTLYKGNLEGFCKGLVLRTPKDSVSLR